MRKRLRKKLHKKEFMEYGVSVTATLPDFSEDTFIKVVDGLVDLGYDSGGGSGPDCKLDLFVTKCPEKKKPGEVLTLTEDDRPRIQQFLESIATDVKVSELKDAWGDF